MALSDSLENYLENIFILSRHQEEVRSIDLAKATGFSKPSVSRAVHQLQDEGYLNFGENYNLVLTEKGKDVASSVYERHLFMTEFFKSIGVDAITAEQDACRIEHVISPQTFELFKEHISYCINDCPDTNNKPMTMTSEDINKIENIVTAPSAADKSAK